MSPDPPTYHVELCGGPCDGTVVTAHHATSDVIVTDDDGAYTYRRTAEGYATFLREAP